jgi:putative two-component system response regulator
MQTDFTTEQANNYLSVMEDENDIVRLVNPVEKQVCDLKEELDNSAVCYKLWGRCDRCENCTSLKAFNTKGQAYKIEILNGHTYWVYSRYMNINSKGYIAETVKDVTDNILMSSDHMNHMGKLITNYNHLLISDPLTNVYNRRFLDEHFIPSLKCCHDEKIIVNLAFLDMDGFKKINDKYGHDAGDTLLKDVANFWNLHFNSRDKGKERLVIRFGGDELLIIACGVTEEDFTDDIKHFDSQMRKICYYTDCISFPFDFTYGIASTEKMNENWNWEDLIQLADRRMYSGKLKKQKQQ